MTAVRFAEPQHAGRRLRQRVGSPAGVRVMAELVAVVAGLAAIAALFLVAAGPGGVALRPLPPPVAVGAEAAPSAAVFSTRAAQHLVLIVDDDKFGHSLELRIAAERLVVAEQGAASVPVTFEVIRAAAEDDLSVLLRGLAEFEAHCGADPCPAIRVIDLRTGARAD